MCVDFWGDNPEQRLRIINIVLLVSLCLSFRELLFAYEDYGYGSRSSLFYNDSPYSGPLILVTRVPIIYASILIYCFNRNIYPNSFLKLMLIVPTMNIAYASLLSWSNSLSVYKEGYYGWTHKWDVTLIYGDSILPEVIFLLSLFSVLLFLFFTIQIYRMKVDFANYVIFFIFSLILLNILISSLWFNNVLEPALEQHDYFFSISNIRFDLILETVMFTIFWYSMACLYSYRSNIKPWVTNDDYLFEQTKSSGISLHHAQKLKEAKELLERGVLTEEEFQEIKDEYLN
uniref:SHOCT domain-containing protein n=1 Tax=uncultured marine microorganism HF4000_APKG7N23 TaxID=455552 RepID=B3T9Z7_9ZZZZ|nr:hypothetical protein ALOHA_HF4000APKG7N23ctg4g18 [uncultured marine microorganism HF4000_APKG7N23]